MCSLCVSLWTWGGVGRWGFGGVLDPDFPLSCIIASPKALCVWKAVLNDRIYFWPSYRNTALHVPHASEASLAKQDVI